MYSAISDIAIEPIQLPRFALHFTPKWSQEIQADSRGSWSFAEKFAPRMAVRWIYRGLLFRPQAPFRSFTDFVENAHEGNAVLQIHRSQDSRPLPALGASLLPDQYTNTATSLHAKAATLLQSSSLSAVVVVPHGSASSKQRAGQRRLHRPIAAESGLDRPTRS